MTNHDSLAARRADIHTFLDAEVYPTLQPEQIFDHPAHRWQPVSDTMLRGACPFCEGKGKTDFVVRANLIWHCRSCGPGGGPIQYLARRRGVPVPVSDADYVDLAADLAKLAGLSLDPASLADERRPG